MNNRHLRGVLARTSAARALVSALIGSTAGLGLAAPAQAAETASLVEEVVVTAQKRTERLQDVPLAVTAVSGDALAARQISDTNNLVAMAPSLTYQQGANVTNSSFRVRGIGSSLFGQGLESSVSVVVDGVVTARGSQGFTDLADIERVEVLRGPQGTLFGKNSSAGVINVVTARPSSIFGGMASAKAEEGGDYRFGGSLTGPLGETLSARLSGYYKHERGQTKNLGAGGHVNGRSSWGLRGKLAWNPTDALSILAGIDYREEDSECCVTVAISYTTPINVALLAPVIASPTNRSVSNDGLTFNDSSQVTYTLQGDLDVGFGTVTSLTAYQDFHLNNNLEVDGFFGPPRFVGVAANSAQANLNGGVSDIEEFSQELRLASPGDSRLTYVVGAYFSELKIVRPFSRRRALCAAGTPAQLGTPCTPTSFQSLASTSTLRGKQLAAFGQGEFELFDHLKLIGGLRIQHDRVSVVGQRTGVTVPGDALFGAPVGIPTPSVRAGESFGDTQMTGRAGMKYEFSRDAQVYATYSRGAKGLGLNTEPAADFANQAPVRAEIADAYELGFKGQTPDRRITVAAAAFLADYKDLQVQINKNIPELGVIQNQQTNAGSSRTKGFELESTVNLLEDLSVSGALTYTKATIDLDGAPCSTPASAAAQVVPFGSPTPVNTCYLPQVRNPTTGVITTPGNRLVDLRGGRLPATPKWTFMLTPTWRFDLGADWVGTVQVAASYRSGQIFSLDQDPTLNQKAYTMVDASLAVGRADSKVRATLFVKNLFDRNFYTNVARGSTNVATPDYVAFRSKNADRFVGVQLDTRF